MSRLGNVAVFNGHPAESISGRCWRMRLENPGNRWWWRLTRLINIIFVWDPDHCRKAYLADVEYSQASVNQYLQLKEQ